MKSCSKILCIMLAALSFSQVVGKAKPKPEQKPKPQQQQQEQHHAHHHTSEIIQHVLSIIADGVSLATHHGNHEAQANAGLSIIQHISSLVAHSIKLGGNITLDPKDVTRVLLEHGLAQKLEEAIVRNRHIVLGSSSVTYGR